MAGLLTAMMGLLERDGYVLRQNALIPPLPAYRQAIYNPGRLTDGEIRASYIARQATFEGLLEEIDATEAGGIP